MEDTERKRRNLFKIVWHNRVIIGYIIFWVYNLTFIGFISLGFAPIVLPSVIQGVRTGMIPLFYALFGGTILLIPFIAAILGITVLRKDIGKLFLLGYGIEGPLMLILGVRFFGLGQTTLPIKIIIGVATAGLLTLLWHILDQEAESKTGIDGIIKAIGLACLVAIGLYASIWIAFYVFPFGRFMLDGLIEVVKDFPNIIGQIWNDYWQAVYTSIWFIFWGIFGGLLFIFTSILFVLLPLVVPWLYLRTWWQGNRGIGYAKAIFIALIVFASIGTLLFITDEQPQVQAFALLENEPRSLAEAQAILTQTDEIKAGLLNAFLARTRYLSAHGELDHIRWLYDDAFEISLERGISIQQNYELLTRPFLYQPIKEIEPAASQFNRWRQGSALQNEPEQAAKLYENFFDEPITKGEKDAVVRAVRTTWDPVRAQQAWQAVDDREVLLTQQTLTHNRLGDGLHQFELHEAYSNQTSIRQEVVYFFSLPESAVITGVWLGDQNGKKFDFRVSPRGASQQLYQEQVQRRIDPALVEQIGPRQYRLRIFPIDPLRQIWEDDGMTLAGGMAPTIEPGEEMHMWLTWQLLEQDGEIPLPQLSLLRNVYWDQTTVRTLPAGLESNEDDWLPTSMTGDGFQTADHMVEFEDGRTVVAQSSNVIIPDLPPNLTFAAVLDRSFSMGDHTDEINRVIDKLQEISPRTDIYLTSSQFRGEPPEVKKMIELEDEDLVYFGGQNPAEILLQFTELNTGADYDAIFVISDDGTFSTTANGTDRVPVPDAPVWMVHVGGILPNGYDDNTLEVLQASGGGATLSAEEALDRLAISWAHPETSYMDGMYWTTFAAGVELPELPQAISHQTDSPFAKNAARQLILAEMRANKGEITDVAILDGLHEIAVDQAIITPFSSMIVLVNQAQNNRLDKLEQQDDRFDREVEQEGETAPGPTVTGVPEPEEWLLIILASLILIYYLKRKNEDIPVFGRSVGR